MTVLSDLFPSSGAQIINQQTFTASGTWTKPAGVLPTDTVIVDLWGAGGGGGHGPNSSSTAGGGGGGGGHNVIELSAALLGATEIVTVGAGGAGGTASIPSGNADGATGGYSEFAGQRAYGGGGGGWHSSQPGSGGGTLSSGARFIDQNGLPRGGEPQTFSPTAGNSNRLNLATPYSDILWWSLPGEWGGMSATTNVGNPHPSYPLHGGGAGSPGSVLQYTKDSVWGGGGGGTYPTHTAGGNSKFGGNGGNGCTGVNTAGSNGQPRGGGGGGGNGSGKGGDGGRGEVVITIIRR